MGEQVVTHIHAFGSTLINMQIIKPLSEAKFLGAVFVFVRNVEFISKQPSQFFVFTILSLQFKFSVHPCILFSLLAFPPHTFPYFLISGYLLRNPDNSNFFFRFPQKVRVIAGELSALYPDVSLSMKTCGQRKAGRSLYSSNGPLRLIISRLPLPCEKRSASGGGWVVMISIKIGKILVIFPERALRLSPQNL